MRFGRWWLAIPLSTCGLLLSALAPARVDPGDGPLAPVSAAGNRFFDDAVLPRLAENGCATCHAQHYLRPHVFEYRELLPYLAMGDSPRDNVLIYKMANLRSIGPDRPTHPGGQRCKTMDDEPCRTFQQWWAVEFGKR